MTGASDTIDAAFVPRRRDDVAVEELDAELVVLDERTGRLHVLNPTATVVWQCLDGDADLATLAVELATAFGAEADAVRADLLTLVRQLADDGLLVGFEPDPPAPGEAEPGDDHEPPDAPPRLLTPPPPT